MKYRFIWMHGVSRGEEVAVSNCCFPPIKSNIETEKVSSDAVADVVVDDDSHHSGLETRCINNDIDLVQSSSVMMQTSLRAYLNLYYRNLFLIYVWMLSLAMRYLRRCTDNR